MNYVFLFEFNPCIFESGFEVQSIHKTKIGAYKAMRKYLEEEYAQWYHERILFGKHYIIGIDKFGEHCDWRIRPVKVHE